MKHIPKVVLFIESSRGASRQYLQGIADYARLNGPWTFKVEPPFYFRDPASKAARLEAIRRWGANGIMTLDLEDIPALQALGIPMILSRVVSMMRPAYSYVDSDNLVIGHMAAHYFLKKGYRHFAYCGFGVFPWSIGRGKAFAKHIKKAGFKVWFYDKLLDTQISFWEDQYAELGGWLKSLPKPVAVLACNDDRGCQVLDACRILNLKVPQEVAVLGVDNDTLVCGLSFCQLSSVEVGFTQAGYKAGEVLDGLMRGKKIKPHCITAPPLSIVTRQSTDMVAIADPDVVAVLSYIRAHIKSSVLVKNVCDQLNISRRTLHKKIVQTIGCSAHEAIARIRLEEISKVLVSTNLTIAQVAAMFNFSSPKHISRFLSRQMGMSPQEYRRKNQPKILPGG